MTDDNIIGIDAKRGITGRGPIRDTFILCNALAYAILTIERLPTIRQERSNRTDMKLLLDHLSTRFMGAEFFLDGARKHLDGIGFPKEE